VKLSDYERKDLRDLLALLNGTGHLSRNLRSLSGAFEELGLKAKIANLKGDYHESRSRQTDMTGMGWIERVAELDFFEQVAIQAAHRRGKTAPAEAQRLYALAVRKDFPGLTPIEAERIRQALFHCYVRFPNLNQCDRCGQYHANKRYCSRRCGKLSGDVRTQKRRRHDELQRKLSQVQALLEQWRPSLGPWKSWVIKLTGYSVKFLTRHENLGDLHHPGTNPSADADLFRIRPGNKLRPVRGAVFVPHRAMST